MTDQQEAMPHPHHVVKHTSLIIIVLTVLLASAAGVAGYTVYQNAELQKETRINSYEECVEFDGSVVQESFPETCVTPMKRSFTRELTPEEKLRMELPEVQGAQDTYRLHEGQQYAYSLLYPANFTPTIASDDKEEEVAFIPTAPNTLLSEVNVRILEGYALSGDSQTSMTLGDTTFFYTLSSDEPQTYVATEVNDLLYEFTFMGIQDIENSVVQQMLRSFIPAPVPEEPEESPIEPSPTLVPVTTTTPKSTPKPVPSGLNLIIRE